MDTLSRGVWNLSPSYPLPSVRAYPQNLDGKPYLGLVHVLDCARGHGPSAWIRNILPSSLLPEKLVSARWRAQFLVAACAIAHRSNLEGGSVKSRNTVFLSMVLVVLCFATVAHAQATRTWVSGVGDDANPCSRTAPCKTYAGAISKTAAGGIISTLDPGGFGAVTITKAMTIEGTGTIASILSSGTNGVVINAGANDTVVLRDLAQHGGNTGLNGIRILNAGKVYVQRCTIQNNSQDGIDIAPSAAGVTTKVFVQGTSILNNTGKGIEVIPTGTAKVSLTVEDSDISGNNSNGLDVTGNGNNASVYNSRITHNGIVGAQVQLTGSNLFIESSVIAFNQTGVTAGLAGQSPVVRLSRNMIVGNTNNGITGGGTNVGFSNNTIVGNGGNNTVSSSSPQQ
jgi:hypothetical protein